MVLLGYRLCIAKTAAAPVLTGTLASCARGGEHCRSKYRRLVACSDHEHAKNISSGGEALSLRAAL